MRSNWLINVHDLALGLLLIMANRSSSRNGPFSFFFNNPELWVGAQEQLVEIYKAVFQEHVALINQCWDNLPEDILAELESNWCRDIFHRYVRGTMARQKNGLAHEVMEIPSLEHSYKVLLKIVNMPFSQSMPFKNDFHSMTCICRSVLDSNNCFLEDISV
ncbi:hypothetical protein [Ferrimonas pelagia]|uniref:hypothetical protein n=1 Tax=Ferrimonas pelagia TaxID=1177826 RepID=UPI0031E7658D